jgi:hypothetical protein
VFSCNERIEFEFYFNPPPRPTQISIVTYDKPTRPSSSQENLVSSFEHRPRSNWIQSRYRLSSVSPQKCFGGVSRLIATTRSHDGEAACGNCGCRNNRWEPLKPVDVESRLLYGVLHYQTSRLLSKDSYAINPRSFFSRSGCLGQGKVFSL